MLKVIVIERLKVLRKSLWFRWISDLNNIKLIAQCLIHLNRLKLINNTMKLTTVNNSRMVDASNIIEIFEIFIGT